MKFIADIHIHSHFSRATSKDLNFEHLTKWAQLKGVQVVGSGDITHPGWLQEMKEKLEPAEEGLFRLKDEFTNVMQREVPDACQGTVRFMLAGEISTIYKKNDSVRKIHNMVYVPTFEAVEKLQSVLEKIGNIRSDGRPILGLDSRDLLEIVLEIDPQAYLIPAHIWTPWFSLFGSKSGFDSIEECFEDLTPHIFALETGLSSDPPMNWRLSALDRYTLVSNSDAHSAKNLAREANQFNTDLSYPAIFEALKSGDQKSYLGTIEFFPEEGKYHYDGHRKCGIRWDPKTTLAHNGICPACGKSVVVGVMHRVEVLADREEGEKPARFHPFVSLIPLPEILAQVHSVGPNSKMVNQNYEWLLSKLGSELFILQDLPLEDIKRVGGVRLGEGIRRMRCGELSIAAGYDGEFGTIRLFEEEEKDTLSTQLNFFASIEEQSKPQREDQQPPLDMPASVEEEDTRQQKDFPIGIHSVRPKIVSEDSVILSALNPQQREAVLCTDASLIIVAGPGTGKTRTLTHRMVYLIAEKGISPKNLLAITFTNKAAEEMTNRLNTLSGSKVAGQIIIRTFHAFGAMILREEGERIDIISNFTILNEQDRHTFLKQIYPDLGGKLINQHLEEISTAKSRLLAPDSTLLQEKYQNDPGFIEIYKNYELALRKNQVVDFDDLIVLPVNLLEAFPEILEQYQHRFRWISVDEYQDINLSQYRLLRLLATPETNVCVIGDPDQAIYGFRGANREYFLKFQDDFPEARTIQLSKNYRSTQPILEASGQIIAKSSERKTGEIWSDVVSNAKIDIYQAPTHNAEAEYVVHQIEKMVGGTSYFSLDSGRVGSEEAASHSFSDFAVLYRLGAQCQFLVEAFQRSGIPYQTMGQTVFYEHKEIQEILSYLWIIYNPDSIFHLEKIKKRSDKIVPFLNELRASLLTQPVAKLIKRIHEFSLNNQSQSQNQKSTELINQLVLKSSPFENRLMDFLESTSLQKETDGYDPRAERVTLLTLHASKGLEFPVLFIVGCEENLIPYQRKGKPFDLEEERRLLYVGMTRAQERLILTHAKTRFLFGQRCENEPSRFLSDIENALIEFKKTTLRKPVNKRKDDQQLQLFKGLIPRTRD